MSSFAFMGFFWSCRRQVHHDNTHLQYHESVKVEPISTLVPYNQGDYTCQQHPIWHAHNTTTILSVNIIYCPPKQREDCLVTITMLTIGQFKQLPELGWVNTHQEVQNI